nr:venom carboxylesterase-6-like [Leptinotarsa decemlineata]
MIFGFLIALALPIFGSTVKLGLEEPIITLPNGKIRGYVSKTLGKQQPFFAYKGIPYAVPPIGNLRFKDPQPAKNWNGIFNATSNTKICYQISTKTHRPQTEDCLYINVYTTVEPGANPRLPVMVSIYGGSFTHGFASTDTVGPDYIMEKGIVVVTFNYRVGPFGFISTGDDVIPGNMGLKDQKLALKWVHDNIHLFGGDPNKVTIQGQSAGGASVTYHILSPSSSGLFRAAIANSGSALCIWANQRNHAVDRAYGIARAINPSFSSKNSTEDLLKLLLSVDAEKIHDTQNKYNAWGPVIEIEHEGAFITESMYEAVKHGRINKVPLLIGFNSEEEISKAADLKYLSTKSSSWDHNSAYLINEDMNIKSNVSIEAGTEIKRIYTASNFTDDLGAVIRCLSDDQFVRGILRFAELQSSYSDVYVYEFSYHGRLGKNNVSYPGCGRVQHGEEGNYLWAGSKLSDYPKSDVTTLNRYVGFITNFVNNLNPTPREEELFQHLRWPTVKPSNYRYMEIDENLAVKVNPRDASYSKWVQVYDKYAVEPLISY